MSFDIIDPDCTYGEEGGYKVDPAGGRVGCGRAKVQEIDEFLFTQGTEVVYARKGCEISLWSGQ